MFENRPQSPTSNNSTNKMKAYFESSSYLNQQEQISIFLKNFPIIKLNEVASINILIGLLIKQNQVLAKKCQEDVSLLRQSFNKHETLLKNIKEVKIQNTRLLKQNQAKGKLEKEISQLKRQVEFQKQNIDRNLKQRNNEMLIKQTKTIVNAIETYNTIFQQIIAQDYKKCESIIKNFDLKGLKNALKSQFLPQSQVADGLIKRQDLEKSFKQIRYRQKSLTNMKVATTEFCTRLRQILRIVPGQMLKSQMDQQVESFLELLQGIVESYENVTFKKGSSTNNINTNRKQGSSLKSPKSKQNQSSKRSLQKLSFEEKGDRIFQNMLSKVAKQYQATQAKQQISYELQNLKQALSNSKQYYQNFLVSLRKQYENEKTAREDQLVAKQQTISFYQKELQKLRNQLATGQQENAQLIGQIKTKEEQVRQARKTVEELKTVICKLKQEKEQNESLKQRTKQQIWKLNEMQVKQRDSIIQQLKLLRKNEKEEFQTQLDRLKRKFKQYELETEALSKDKKAVQKCLQSVQAKLQRKEEDCKLLQSKLQYKEKSFQQLSLQNKRKNNQIDKFKESLKQSQHQKILQTSYIQQLQNKTKSQQAKIQTLLDKKQIDKSAKKELTSLKSSFQAQKKHSAGLQQIASQLKQENHRLKSMIHQMKRELEQVYVRLNNLKEIQEQRERLMFEAQNSQRARNQILSDYEDIKFSIMQIEAENKALQLQVKHYKNAINRIEGISSYVNP